MATKTIKIPKEIFAVEYAGFYEICSQPSYESLNLLNSEHVGIEQAKATAECIVKMEE